MAVVVYHPEFAHEAGSFDTAVQDEILAYAMLLREAGHSLGRPHADTLNGNDKQPSNLKELRLTVNRVEWRIAYAFTTAQIGVLLAGGPKNGIEEALFYNRLMAVAVRRLEALERELAARSGAGAEAAQLRGERTKKGKRK